jgi:hypothetical protein
MSWYLKSFDNIYTSLTNWKLQFNVTIKSINSLSNKVEFKISEYFRCYVESQYYILASKNLVRLKM